MENGAPRAEVAELLEAIPQVPTRAKPEKWTARAAKSKDFGVRRMSPSAPREPRQASPRAAARDRPGGQRKVREPQPNAWPKWECWRGTTHGCKRCDKIHVQSQEVIAQRRNEWIQRRGGRVAAKMTAEMRRVYLKVFELLDEDGSGALDFEEISLALRLVGLQGSLGHLQQVINKHATDGELDFHAFLMVIESSMEVSPANGSSESKAKKEAAQNSAKGDAESHNQVLPFHLFLPAYSRKKNVEFVVNLELTEGKQLPYPLDDDEDLHSAHRASVGNRRRLCRQCRQADTHNMLRIAREVVPAYRAQAQAGSHVQA